MKTVVIVEDDRDIASILEMKLKKAGYNTHLLKDGWEALTYLVGEKKDAPVALVLDLMLPGRSGHDLLNAIRSVLPEVRIFIFSSHKESFSLIPKRCVEGLFNKADGVDPLIEALNRACPPSNNSNKKT